MMFASRNYLFFVVSLVLLDRTVNAMVFGMGSNSDYQLGLPVNSTGYLSTEIMIGLVPATKIDISKVVAAGQNSWFISFDGIVYSCGLDPSSSNRFSRVPAIYKQPANVIDITIGYHLTFFTTSHGEVFATGSNYMGILGLGDDVSRNTPTLITSFSNSVVIAAAASYLSPHALFLEGNGHVYSTGLNLGGALGLGIASERECRHTPTMVTIDNAAKVTSIAVGGKNSYAVLADGGAYGWGSNVNGQLGVSNMKRCELCSTAVKIEGLVNVKKVVASSTFSMFMTRDGKVLSLGPEAGFELAVGDFLGRNTPTMIGGAFSSLHVTDLAVGYRHAMFVANSTMLYGSGYNLHNVMGISDGLLSFSYATPTMIGYSSLGRIVSLSTAYDHSLLVAPGFTTTVVTGASSTKNKNYVKLAVAISVPFVIIMSIIISAKCWKHKKAPRAPFVRMNSFSNKQDPL